MVIMCKKHFWSLFSSSELLESLPLPLCVSLSLSLLSSPSCMEYSSTPWTDIKLSSLPSVALSIPQRTNAFLTWSWPPSAKNSFQASDSHLASNNLSSPTVHNKCDVGFVPWSQLHSQIDLIWDQKYDKSQNTHVKKMLGITHPL